jgi:hypothetical protein
LLDVLASTGRPDAADLASLSDPEDGLLLSSCGGETDFSILHCVAGTAAQRSVWWNDPSSQHPLPTEGWVCNTELTRCAAMRDGDEVASIDLGIVDGRRVIRAVRHHPFRACQQDALTRAESRRWLCRAERAITHATDAPYELVDTTELIEIEVTRAARAPGEGESHDDDESDGEDGIASTACAGELTVTSRTLCGDAARSRATELLPEIAAWNAEHMGEGCMGTSCLSPAADEPGLRMQFVQDDRNAVLHVVEHLIGTCGEAEDRTLGQRLDAAVSEATGCAP